MRLTDARAMGKIWAAMGLAGTISGLQNRFFGFDSRHRLHYIFDSVGGIDRAREILKAEAYSKAYVPPEDPVLLARALVWHLRDKFTEERDARIAISKELAAVKRGKAK